MDTQKKEIPQATIEMLARSFFRESYSYGFRQVDYLRFVNLLLDYAMKNKKKTKAPEESKNELKDPKAISLPLKGQRIIIRDLDASKDRINFEKWLEDEYGRYFLLSLTTAQAISFDDLIDKSYNIITIICLADYTPIGSVGFLNYDPIQKKAELRKLIGESKMRGMGLAREATQLWIQYGIKNLNLKKIYLNTLNTNIRNIKLNEELGFQVEGILRNEIFFDGKYHDLLRMGLWTG
ncbi:MAG: GNAT family N-acetyltransferase [bacterium]